MRYGNELARSLILGILGTSLVAAGAVVEQTGVSIVQVPVFVSDSRGNPVLGLTEKDFEVYEDGLRQEIEVFVPISMGAAAEAPLPPGEISQGGKVELPRYESRRHLFLVFDFTQNTPAGVRRMLQGASSFVEKNMGDQDLVSLWVISPARGLELATNLTNDRSYLKGCITRLERGGRLPSTAYTAGVASLVGPSDVWGPRMDSFGQRKSALSGEREADGFVARVRQETFLDELERLSQVIAGMPGRKFCLLFSNGFGLQGTMGSARPVVAAESRSAELAFGAFLQPSCARREIFDQMDRITRKFSTADCQLYAFDTTGLYSDSNLAFVDGPAIGRPRLFSPGLDSLGMLAQQTGGECYPNMNDLSRPIAKLMSKTSSYYLLGYRTPAQTSPKDAEKFHRIKVRVHAKGVRVGYRPGYIGAAPAAFEAESAWVQLAAIALYDLPGTRIAFKPAAHAATGTGTEATVGVTFEVPGEQFADWKGDLPLEFYVFVLDDTEQVRTYARGGRLISERDVADRILRAGISYADQLQLPRDGEYTLRFVVRNAGTGDYGSATMKINSSSSASPPVSGSAAFPAGS
ncbi:MAG: VWA domain-containing protein [Acidobacteriota bacterium]